MAHQSDWQKAMTQQQRDAFASRDWNALRKAQPSQAQRDILRTRLDQRVAESKAAGHKPATFDYLKKLNKQLDESIKANKPKREKPHQHKGGFLEADTSGSTCFDYLVYSKADGGVFANFINPTRGMWFYPMSRAEAKEWFDAASLGGFFNDAIR